MINWNYVETVEACKSAWSVSEFGRARNYTPDDSGKTTWGYRELQVSRKLEHGPRYYKNNPFKLLK